jgi:hypothetical protein
MAKATPAARLASGTGEWRKMRSLPAWGASTQAFPTMSLGFGCHGSASGLLSPWMTYPVAAEPPVTRWMTIMPSPISPLGTR